MSFSYKAYISYKHEDLDDKVATLIEKGLTEYRIPSKIQKKTGVKKLDKIFRDKEELPITNDSTGTISGELENSEYMIVICSTSTGLSNFVENEIKLFLKNHAPEQVLAVLADGAAIDTIPKILSDLECKVKTFDFRTKDKNTLNTELSKLASALIGCSEDELLSRKRPVKAGWITAILSLILIASLCFCGYLLHCQKKFQESYIKSLTSQSLYLSNESDKMLSEKERLTATQLALAALPNESSPERPIIPEAVRAITNATLSYVSNTSSNCDSVWNYVMPGNKVTAYDTSPNGRFLVAMDLSHNIKLWDTATHKEIFSAANSEFAKVLFVNDDAILLCGANELRTVSTATGAPAWHAVPPKDEKFYSKLITVAGDSVLAPNDQGSVYRISAADGSMTDTYSLDSAPDSESKSIEKILASPSGDKFAYVTSGASAKDTLVVYDTVNKKASYVSLDKEEKYNTKDYISGIFWPTDENLYYNVSLTEPKKNEIVNDSVILTENHSELVCLSAEDLSTNWEYKLSYTSMSYDMDLTYVPSRNAVAVYEGNMIRLIDNNSGEVLNSCDLNEPIVKMNIESSTPYPVLVTESGLMARIELSSGFTTAYTSRCFPNDIDRSAGNIDFFVHKKDSNEIIHFKNNVYDEGLQLFTECPDFSLINDSNTFVTGNTAVIFGTENGKINLSYFDAVSKKYLGSVNLGTSNFNEYKLLGTFDNKIYVSHIKDKVSVIEIDMSSAAQKSYDISIGDLTPKSFGKIYFDNGYIAYVAEQDDRKYIDIRNLSTGKNECYPIPVKYTVNNIIFDHDAGILYVSCKDKDLVVLPGEQNIKEVVLPENWSKTTMVSMLKDDQKIVLSNGSKIIVKDYLADTLYELKCPALQPSGAFICSTVSTAEKKFLFVPFNNGLLFCYNADTGEFIGQTEYTMNKASTGSGEMTFNCNAESGLLFMHCNSILSIIDIKSQIEITAVKSCFGYNKDSDTFIVSAFDKNNKDKLGYFKHYTLEELIKKGKNIIGDIEMSDAKKAEYGIG